MAPVQAPAQGEDDSAVPTYPLYNIRSGQWSERVPTLAISIKQLLEFYQLVFLEFSRPVQMLGTTRSCLTQTGASCVLTFEIRIQCASRTVLTATEVDVSPRPAKALWCGNKRQPTLPKCLNQTLR